MTRWLLATCGLVGALLCSARAEYLRITYSLSPAKSLTPAAPEEPEGKVGRRRRGGGGLPPGPKVQQPQPQPQVQVNPETPTIKADAVVEYTRSVIRGFKTGNSTVRTFPVIYHKWGKTALIPNSDITLSAIQEKGIA